MMIDPIVFAGIFVTGAFCGIAGTLFAIRLWHLRHWH